LSADDIYYAGRADTILLLNWKPTGTWSDAAGGNAGTNATIDQMANSIKSLGNHKIMLGIFHEPENDVTNGGSPSCGSSITYKGSAGTTTDYVNMWHNVRARFDAAGVTNVVWVMNYMGYSTWNCMVKDLWPGNSYVDWVTWDPYMTNNATSFNGAVSPFYNVLTSSTDSSHNFTSKPWGLSEWGVDPAVDQAHAYADYDGAKAAVDNGTFPNLKLYVVFDAVNPVDFRILYSGSSTKDTTELSHYSAFANDSHFSTPTSNPTPPPPPPADTTPPTITLTAPANNQTVSGTITVSGNASDSVGVSSVTMRVDNVYIATDTTAPYSFGLDTTKYSNGTHTIVLRAFDAANNMGESATVTVKVDNTTTTGGSSGGGSTGVSTTTTGTGTTTVITPSQLSPNAAPIAVKGTIVIDSGASSAAVSIDGKPVATNSIDTTQLTNGTHVLTIHENGKTVQQKISVHNPWPKAALNDLRVHRVAYAGTTVGVLVVVSLVIWRFMPRFKGKLNTKNLAQFGAGRLVKPHR
jgi:hypothetical protein